MLCKVFEVISVVSNLVLISLKLLLFFLLLNQYSSRVITTSMVSQPVRGVQIVGSGAKQTK